MHRVSGISWRDGAGKRFVISLLIVAGLTTTSPPAGAMEVQPLGTIRDAAEAFLRERIEATPGRLEITVGELDNRLRLARCEAPLHAALPEGGRLLGRITVNVSCEGVKPWSLLVQASVKRYLEVVTAQRPLGRGAQLSRGDLSFASVDISTLTGGYFSAPEEAVGMVLKRSVRAGTVLGPVLVQQPILIKRGEKVIIEASSGGVMVRMEGEALEAGARGEVIKVRNLSSSQVVEAEVITPGVVRVRM